jgi:hypothetical protein
LGNDGTMQSTHFSKQSGTNSPVPLSNRKFSKARTIADKLDVCPKTIFRWANQGKITRHKINARVVLFDESDVLAMLNSAKESLF